MALSLSIALWGFCGGRKIHRASGPFLLALTGSVELVAGVVGHRFPAKQVIGIGAVALVAATLWNVVLRRACEVSAGAAVSGGD